MDAGRVYTLISSINAQSAGFMGRANWKNFTFCSADGHSPICDTHLMTSDGDITTRVCNERMAHAFEKKIKVARARSLTNWAALLIPENGGSMIFLLHFQRLPFSGNHKSIYCRGFFFNLIYNLECLIRANSFY